VLLYLRCKEKFGFREYQFIPKTIKVCKPIMRWFSVNGAFHGMNFVKRKKMTEVILFTFQLMKIQD